jgi:hypothetical protein
MCLERHLHILGASALSHLRRHPQAANNLKAHKEKTDALELFEGNTREVLEKLSPATKGWGSTMQLPLWETTWPTCCEIQ